MSPVGGSFRQRCRRFPALTACTTIDWFTPWPPGALLAVSQQFLAAVDLGVPPAVKAAVMQMCADVHTSASEACERFFVELRRRCFCLLTFLCTPACSLLDTLIAKSVCSSIHLRALSRHYTTPQSYLDLIELYKSLLRGQRSATGEARERLLNGLKKLSETNEQVEQMRGELSALQPVILEKSQACLVPECHSACSRGLHITHSPCCAPQAAEAMQAEVIRDQASAEAVRTNVAREEAAVAQTAMEAKALATEAKADLAQALPALQAAVDSLNALNKGASVFSVTDLQWQAMLLKST